MKKYLAALATSVSLCAVVFSGCVEESVEGEDELELDELAAPDDAESQGTGTLGWVDLRPVNNAYCENGLGVKNFGTMGAAATTLRVKYSWSSGGLLEVVTVYYNIPALAAGATHWVPETYEGSPPAGCYDADSDCDIALRADFSNIVSEMNETNNSVTTQCYQL